MDVVLVIGPADDKQIIKLPMGIKMNPPTLEKLKVLTGAENVRIS
jgi:hypothetical protein